MTPETPFKCEYGFPPKADGCFLDGSSNGNYGYGNTGVNNRGVGNSGSGNIGNDNSGNNNLGNQNSGSTNRGDQNTGTCAMCLLLFSCVCTYVLVHRHRQQRQRQHRHQQPGRWQHWYAVGQTPKLNTIRHPTCRLWQQGRQEHGQQQLWQPKHWCVVLGCCSTGPHASSQATTTWATTSLTTTRSPPLDGAVVSWCTLSHWELQAARRAHWFCELRVLSSQPSRLCRLCNTPY